MEKPIVGVMKRGLMIGAIFVATVLVQQGNTVSASNSVKSLDPVALDKILSQHSFSGLVTVMASWCPPCRKELPDLAQLYRKYSEKGISIIAVSIDADGPSSVQPLVNKLDIPFPVYWVGGKAVKQYKIVGIPTLMVVHKGTIIEKLPGRQHRSALESKIRKLIP